MFDRTIESDPRPAAPQSRATYRMRDGHRREYDAHKDGGSISFLDRSERALADVGIYRCVSFRDLAETHFGGHPYTTRRAVNAWIREGLAKESTARGPKGRPFKVLTLTRKGAAAIRNLAAGQGLDRGQHIRSTARLLQHAQLAHDTAIYRACGHERQRLLERGATIRRVRLDGELKSTVASRSESARVRDGRRAADAERHRAAAELGLPIDARGRVLYPDAQIEYVDADGRSGRVNVEVTSGHYRAGSVRAKAAAGFRMHANGPAGRRVLRILGPGDGRTSIRGAGRARPGRPRALAHTRATLEDQHRADRSSSRSGGTARRIAARVPGAVLVRGPRRSWREHRLGPGPGAHRSCRRDLRRRPRRRARRPRAARGSRRAIRPARRGRSPACRCAQAGRRGRLGLSGTPV